MDNYIIGYILLSLSACLICSIYISLREHPHVSTAFRPMVSLKPFGGYIEFSSTVYSAYFLYQCSVEKSWDFFKRSQDGVYATVE